MPTLPVDVLFFSRNFTDAKQEVEERGGRILHHFSDEAFVASLPASQPLDTLNACYTTPLAPLDTPTQRLVDAWRAMKSKRHDDSKESTPIKDWGEWGHYPLEPFQEIEDGEDHSKTPGNKVLRGRVAVNIVSVSGLQDELHLNNQDHLFVIEEAQKALDFLVQEEATAEVSVVYKNELLTVDVDFPGNKTRLGSANWEGITAMTAHGGFLYAVQGTGLWRINRVNGDFLQIGTANWEGITAMTSHGNFLYVAQGEGLWRVNPKDGGYVRLGDANWSGTTAMTTLDAFLYVAQGEGLWRVNPKDGGYVRLGDADWSGTTLMTSLGSFLYVIQGGRLWQVSATDGDFEHVGVGNYSAATAIAALPSRLYVTIHDKLWVVFLERERTRVISPFDWSGSTAMVALDGIYIAQGEGLWTAQTGNNENDRQLFEAPWRDAVLVQKRYKPGPEGMSSFTSDLADEFNTPSAFVIFLTKYPLYHPGYADPYSAYTVMEFRTNIPGRSEVNQVMAHETGHIFKALDEYASSNCDCRTAGENRVPNNNCVNCTDHSIDCLMKANTLFVCNWTRGQLGWAYWDFLGTADWSNTIALTTHSGFLYAAQGEGLWRVNPKDGGYVRLGDADWSGTTAMTTQGAFLYVAQGEGLWRVNPKDGGYVRLGDANWRGITAMTTQGAFLYVAQGDALWRVNPKDGGYVRLGDANWPGVTTLTSHEAFLYTFQGDRLWRVNPNNGDFVKLQESDWSNATTLTTLDNFLYTVQDERLWRVDPRNGNYWGYGKHGWADITAMTSWEGKLYAVLGDRLVFATEFG